MKGFFKNLYSLYEPKKLFCLVRITETVAKQFDDDFVALYISHLCPKLNEKKNREKILLT